MSDKPTEKQEKFAQHYVLHNDATKAYHHAFDTANMLDTTVHCEACKLLKHPKVAPRIEELKERIQKRAEEKFDLTADQLLLQHQRIAFMDVGEFFDWTENSVKPKAKEDLTLEQRQMITGLKQTKGNTSSIELLLANRQHSMDVLGRYLGIDKVRHDHSHTHVLKDAAADFQSKFDSFTASLEKAGASKPVH